jgi:hypothetical protein
MISEIKATNAEMAQFVVRFIVDDIEFLFFILSGAIGIIYFIGFIIIVLSGAIGTIYFIGFIKLIT